jgi:carbonic anhydrase
MPRLPLHADRCPALVAVLGGGPFPAVERMHMTTAMRRASFVRAVLSASVLSGAAFPARARAATKAAPIMSPDQALARLKAGNAKFIAGTLDAQRAVVERRTDLANEQRPFAMILSCADSRVPPEDVFDQTVGDLFVCRVAGNFLDPGVVGSFEYAVDHIGTPSLLIVLGHQRCGAVTAAVEMAQSGHKTDSSIQAIIDAVRPAVAATPRGTLGATAYVDAVVRTNARLNARAAGQRSAILREAVAHHQLKIIPAYYSLDSGRVTLLS